MWLETLLSTSTVPFRDSGLPRLGRCRYTYTDRTLIIMVMVVYSLRRHRNAMVKLNPTVSVKKYIQLLRFICQYGLCGSFRVKPPLLS